MATKAEQQRAAKREERRHMRERESLTGKDRMPRGDAPIEVKHLDVPEITLATVFVQRSKLIIKVNEVEGASRYDFELRRGPGHAATGNHSSDKTKTEFKTYPIGVPGVPEVRVRAVADDALSLWTPWTPSNHDLGELD